MVARLSSSGPFMHTASYALKVYSNTMAYYTGINVPCDDNVTDCYNRCQNSNFTAGSIDLWVAYTAPQFPNEHHFLFFLYSFCTPRHYPLVSPFRICFNQSKWKLKYIFERSFCIYSRLFIQSFLGDMNFACWTIIRYVWRRHFTGRVPSRQPFLLRITT